MRLAGVAAARAAGSLARGAATPYHAVKALAILPPERLRVAPPDIRTADPTVADEIYAGYFSFDGKTVEAQGRSPFAVRPPSAAWRRSLAGFSWLRHLRAADKALTRANARALVADFLAQRLDADDPALEPAVTARRLLSLLAQSPILLDGAEQEFYERFMAALARDARAVFRALTDAKARGAVRLTCAVALTEFSICADNARKFQSLAVRILGVELDRQILSDGGHVSRNPQVLLDLLLDLLPMRQVFAARGAHPPDAALRAIDRMIPMLRMLQHGDGSLALFNGMGATQQDRLATILSHDEAPGAAPINAPYAGYQRLEAGEALLIVDAGPPPPFEHSRHAHAGCLSFEYSLGRERVVVNCGAPASHYEAARELARATAAHSTLVVADRSSCRIAPALDPRRRRAGRMLAGPSAAPVDRRQSKSGQVLELSHNGYAREFGLLHERVLALTHDGVRLIGEDRLVPAPRATHRVAPVDFVVRFHIHPRAALTAVAAGQKVEIALPSGARLLFQAVGFTPTIEESVYFAGAEGARKCFQIALAGRAAPYAKVRWSFRRLTEAALPAAGEVPQEGDLW
jgi:uncharacterized heparinase superfamily protein